MIGAFFNHEFVIQLGLFGLASYIGYMLIFRIPTYMYMPLTLFICSLTGIIAITCMQIFSQGSDFKDDEFWRGYATMAWIGLIFATFNMVAGLIAVYRILDLMLLREDRKDEMTFVFTDREKGIEDR